MRYASETTRLLIFIILGLVLGGIFGEFLGWLFGDFLGDLSGAGATNNVRNFFVKAFEYSVGIQEEGILIDLYTLKFRFGIGFKLNFCSFLGLFVSLYIMKWSK